MKKMIALLLALVMIVGLVACGAKEEAAAPAATEAAPAAPEAAPAAPEAGNDQPYAGQTVKWWTYPYTGEDQAQWDELTKSFTEQTGITIETTIIPWGADGAAKLSAGFLGGVGPDVLYMTAETAYDMISGGHLADLATVLKPETLENQIYAANTATDGVQYMLPMGMGVGYRCLYFNKALLAEAGVTELPTTRDELVDVCLKIKEANVCEYPIMLAMNGDAENVFASVLGHIWTGGGDFMKNGEPCFDSPENLQTMQWLYDLIYKHEVLSTDANAVTAAGVAELFAQGKAAIIGASISSLPTIKEFMSEDEYNITMGVAVEEGGQIKTFSPMDMLAVNANSKVPGAAAEWMEYLVSDEGRAAWRAVFMPAGFPVNKTENYPVVYEHPDIEASFDQIATSGRALPIGKGTQTMLDAINANTQLMFAGELTPEEAVAAIQAACVAAQEG